MTKNKRKKEWIGLAVAGGVVLLAVLVILFFMLVLPVLQANRALQSACARMERFSESDTLIVADPYVDDVGVIPREANAMLTGKEAQDFLARLLPLVKQASYDSTERSLAGLWEPSVTVRSATEQASLYFGKDSIYVAREDGYYAFDMDKAEADYQAFLADLDALLKAHVIDVPLT